MAVSKKKTSAKKTLSPKDQVAEKKTAKISVGKKAAAPGTKITPAKKAVAKKAPAKKKTAAKKAPTKKAPVKRKVTESAATTEAKAQEAKVAATVAAVDEATAGGVSLMDREERNDRIKELMALASDHGFLTFEDINEAFPEDLVVVEDIDKIVGLLQSMEIDIIKQDDVEEYQARLEKEQADKQSARSDVLDDPVRMYLKQMGQVPLLTREQEVEISMRIEEAEIATTKMFKPPRLRNRCLSRCD